MEEEMTCEFCGQEPYVFLDWTPENGRAAGRSTAKPIYFPTTHRVASKGSFCDVILNDRTVGFVRWKQTSR